MNPILALDNGGCCVLVKLVSLCISWLQIKPTTPLPNSEKLPVLNNIGWQARASPASSPSNLYLDSNLIYAGFIVMVSEHLMTREQKR
ncbi:hypothetical protein Y1Q_0019959 [Alligator mississippiensis]|uniref:Uncharacterized protein n=1 Tax=Alligator mississippiensis TaxID=8496 RepID=A0A151PEQ5_ALLMI|nr:hypothetical protein Y1Q_0019959 [Alligator mississippiensis]